MIKKDVFVSMLNAVKIQYDKDRSIGDAIDSIGGNDNNPFIYNTHLCEEVIKLLAVDLDDEWAISYFVYDLDWGVNSDRLKIFGENGKPITIDTLDKLYDFITKGEDYVR